MKAILGFVLGCLIALSCIATFWLFVDMLRTTPTMIKQDCSLAAFHPDFTTKMKAACRKVKA